MSPQPLFPAHIRTFDGASDFLASWVEMFGGVLLGELETLETAEALHVGRTAISFAGAATVLTLGLTVNAEMACSWYTFDLRRADGELLWRHDCHPGHEAAHGGPHHLHIGPEEGHRIAAGPITLERVATKIVATHVNLAG